MNRYTLIYADSNEVGISCDTLEELSEYLERDRHSVYGSVRRLVVKGDEKLRVYNYDGIKYDLYISDEYRKEFLDKVGKQEYKRYRNIHIRNTETGEEYDFKNLYNLAKFLKRPYDGVRKSVYYISKGQSGLVDDYIVDRNGVSYRITLKVYKRNEDNN